jgi:hypothetical protein
MCAMRTAAHDHHASVVIVGRIFLIAASLEGLTALAYLFRIPSDEQSAFLFGFSRVRLLMGLLALIPLLILLYAALRSLLQRSYTSQLQSALLGFLKTEQNASHLITFLSLGLVYGTFILLLVFVFPKAGSGLLRLVFDRAGSLLLWGMALCAQFLALVLGRYRAILKRTITMDRLILLREGFFFTVALLTLIEWSILAFHLDWFHGMYGWYFGFFRRAPSRAGVFLALLLVTFLILRVVLTHHHRRLLVILLLIVLGYTLQVGFGFIEGEGWESLRTRYVEKGRSVYSTIVSKDEFNLQSITDYENNYANIYRYLSTKPHGYLMVHALTKWLLELLPFIGEVGDAFIQLTRLMAVLYPLLAMLVLLPLERLSRKVLPDAFDHAALMLYLCFPSVILFTLQLDQVIFPTVFVGGILLATKTDQKSSSRYAIILGVYLYLSTLLSFSLLPMMAFIPIYLSVRLLVSRDRTTSSLKALAVKGILMLGALLAMHVLMKGVFHIDLYQRFFNAMAAHRLAKGLMWRERWNTLVNFSEYGLWMGFGLIPLLVAQIVSAIWSIQSGSGSRLDALSVTFLITLILVASFGTTRSEVARLWLFTLPIVSLMVSRRINLLPFGRRTSILLLAGSQVITTYCIFLFQFPYQ